MTSNTNIMNTDEGVYGFFTAVLSSPVLSILSDCHIEKYYRLYKSRPVLQGWYMAFPDEY